jgi:phospholipid/cholesterol/gamma-HCH transport system substrate-binding protein
MSFERGREMLVGFAAIFVLVFVVALSHSGSQVGDVSDGDYRVTAVFNRVDGISVGDDVQVAGVSIGSVESASLDSNYRAALTLRINGGVDLPLDTSAAIHTDGLFGGKFIVLEPGGEIDSLGNGDQITFTQSSQIIGELLDLIISEGRAVRGLPAEETNDGS